MNRFLFPPHLGELGVVEQVGSVAVDERAEGEAVPPAEVEVLDVDVLVGRRLALAPQQQALLRRHLLHRDVLDGEPGQKGTITYSVNAEQYREYLTVLRIRRIHMFLTLPDPDPLFRKTGPSIIKQK
jgi:hypothetical protein